MTITRAALLTAVGYRYKYALTIKQADAYEAMQYIADDIADDFEGSRDLQDSTSNLPLTEDIPYIDVSTVLTGLRYERIQKVVLIDTGDHNNDKELLERDYLNDYLKLLPDPTNVGSAELSDFPKIYARYQDNMYVYPVPHISTLFLKIYFDKVHPTISGTQDIIYPSSFLDLMTTGVHAKMLDMADRKDGTLNDRMQKYYIMKSELLPKYKKRPNLKRSIKMNW